MVENYVIAYVVLAIFAIKEIIFLYRERAWDSHRDALIKNHRNRETDLLNRIMAGNAPETFMMLNGQDTQIENSKAATCTDNPQKTVDDLLDAAGLGADGYSEDGVSVG